MFFYEFIGTFALVFAINSTRGNAVGIGMSLFFLLTLGAQFTGAHYNPAVTVAVFINKGFSTGKVVQDLVMAFLFIVAQLTGGICGVLVIYSLVENQKMSATQRAAQFPHLIPETTYWGQALAIETMCAFIFAMANLICKDPIRHAFAANDQKNAGFFGCMTIAMTLCAMIFIAGPHTGAAVNPAVGVANHIMSTKLFANGTVFDDIRKVYIAGGFLGGILAGFFSWAHGWFVNFAQNGNKEPEADVEAPATTTN